jgi:uncharacterized membrane protein
MKIHALTYGATALVFFGLDFIWLSIMGNTLYRPLLGDLLRAEFDPVPAMLFYLLYVVGVVIFAAYPAIDVGHVTTALWRGALFGLCAYATYDLTNQATLRNWPTTITVADMVWGATVTALSAAVGYRVGQAASRWSKV